MNQPTDDDKAWYRKMDACKRSVCRVNVIDAGDILTCGSGWVVRNDTVAALVAVGRVFKGCLYDAPDDGGKVVTKGATAEFAGGQTVKLAGSRALLAPTAEGEGGLSRILDVVAIILPAGQQFPAPPVPCALEIATVGDVGAGGEYSLLHRPYGDDRVVVSPRYRLVVGGPSGAGALPSWLVRHRAPTTGGSSGGMLVDHQCRAFAVHMTASTSDGTKKAVLLSAFHARLGNRSPWCGLAPLVRTCSVRVASAAELDGVCAATLNLPTDHDKAWLWKIDACRGSVCVVKAIKAGDAGKNQSGTGWVVRNDTVAALVTACHVVKDFLDDAPDDGGKVVTKGATAEFAGGQTVKLAGSRALLAPTAEGEGGLSRILDVVAIVLPTERYFPVHPVPCAVDIASAGDVGGGGEYSLLHCPGGDARSRVTLHPRKRLVVGGPSGAGALPSWLVRHRAPTAGGSSGGMLVDHQCRAFAVHVAASASDETKKAVLLSAFHARLGNRSPWCGLAPLEHTFGSPFHVPPRRGPFVGREKDLKRLRKHVQTLAKTVVVSAGISGVGKTFLAAESVRRLWLSGAYTVVAWLRAQRVPDLEVDLARLGVHLGVPYPYEGQQSPGDRALFVVDWLNQNAERGVLLVFDNATAYGDVEMYMPTNPVCRCILTARDRGTFPPDAVLSLRPFSLDEALELLGLLSGRDVSADLPAATELCKAVGKLPLAVGALAVYSKDSGDTFPIVLNDLRDNPAAAPALIEEQLAVYEHPHSVVRALSLVCGLLDEASRSSLRRLALLAADRIPAALIGGSAQRKRLNELDIIASPESGLFSIHRLVQSVVVAQMSAEEVRRVASELVEELFVSTQDFDKHKHSTWGAIAKVAPHADALLSKSAAAVRADPDAIDQEDGRLALMRRLADYYECVSTLPAAERLAKLLLSEAESRLGATHPIVLNCELNIACLVEKQGRYQDALEMYQVVKRKMVTTLGEEHLEVARAQHSLAGVLETLGRYEDALVLLRAAERKQVAALREENPDVAVTQHTMASVLARLGRYEEALVLLREVKPKQVAALGEEHPSVATTQHSLASVLEKLGRYDEALVLLRTAERKQVAALGEKHRDVAVTQHTLASVLGKLGRYAEALVLLRAAERKKVAALGEEHREVARTQHSLAGVLKELGRYEEALVLLRAAQRKQVAALGEKHPDVATTQNDLAGVLVTLGRYEEVLVLLRAVERKTVAALGEDHISVTVTQHNLAGVLEAMGRYDEALVLLRTVERKEVAALGEAHPSVAATQHNVAGVLVKMGRYVEALVLLRAAERKKVAALGEDHLDVARTQHSLASVLVNLDQYDEALVLLQTVERKQVAALGEEHPSVAATRDNLAGVLVNMGRYDEALVLLRAAERNKVATLGEGHVEVARTQHNLAGVLENLGRYDEALELLRTAERKQVAALGEQHLEVARTQHNLASVLDKLGRYEEALVLLRAVERKMVAALGEEHPSVAVTQNNLAGVLETLGRYEEALELLRAVERKMVAALGEEHPDVAIARRSLARVLRVVQDNSAATADA